MHWKSGAYWNLGREGQFMDEVVNGLYVAFFFYYKTGVCFCHIREHINDSFVFFMSVLLQLASRLHIQIVNPEPPHFSPLSSRLWPSLLHLFPKSKHTTKVSSECVTNSMCVPECIVKDHWKKTKRNKNNRRRMVNYFLLLLLIW